MAEDEKRWEGVYRSKEEAETSWFEDRPQVSLDLIAETGADKDSVERVDRLRRLKRDRRVERIAAGSTLCSAAIRPDITSVYGRLLVSRQRLIGGTRVAD